MLWFWIDLFFPFFSIHVLLTVDLYIYRGVDPGGMSG